MCLNKNKEKIEIQPTEVINDIDELLFKMKIVLKDKYDKKNLNELDDKIKVISKLIKINKLYFDNKFR